MTTMTANLTCRCGSSLVLTQQTRHAFGLEGQHVMVAVERAGMYLGWRKTVGDAGRFWCPKCAADAKLECLRCQLRTDVCACIDQTGPRIEARHP